MLQLKSGEITPEEAENHPNKNIVTQSLGVTSVVEIDFVRMTVKEDDTLLLCSDGLSDMLSLEEIRNVMNHYSDIEKQVEKAVEAANEAGGRDNITVAIAKIQLQEEVA